MPTAIDHPAHDNLGDYSVYKRVPNLDAIRLKRLQYFNFIGVFLLCANSIVWTAVWWNLQYPLLATFSLSILFVSAWIFYLTKQQKFMVGFGVMISCVLIWITVIIFAASGPGRGYGGSVHSYFLTIAAIIYFALIGRRKLWHLGIPVFCVVLFLIFEFQLIVFEPLIKLPEDVRRSANYYTWFSAIGSFLIFYIWLAKDIHDVEQRLNFSNSRMEELLENILPPTIAQKLSEEGKTFAEGFVNCTVLFADIINFTELSRQQSPNELVKLLNRVFADFDDATHQQGLEKIKTIGDAYMVASGVPTPIRDHAQRAVDLAQQFLTIMEKYPNLSIRIGINSGPVTAGVIGKRKFIYDIWGDTVNIAARMEQHGLENQIQISESTKELLTDKENVTHRGEIKIKGIGQMNTFLIVSSPTPAL